MRDLDGLIEKIEGLDGPDQEIDYEIGRTIIPDDWRDAVDDSGRPIKLNRTFRAQQQIGDSRPTASLDAAIALVERVLPGWSWSLIYSRRGRGHEGVVIRSVPHTVWTSTRDGKTHGATPAIALCLALLRALQQEEKR